MEARQSVEPAHEQAFIGAGEVLKSKQASSSVKCANTRWDAHAVVRNMETLETNIAEALGTVSSEMFSAACRKVAIVEKTLVASLRWFSTYIKMESQGAISRIRAELERDDGGALQSVTTFHAVLRSLLAEVGRGLPSSAGSIASPESGAAGTASGAIIGPSKSLDAETSGVPER